MSIVEKGTSYTEQIEVDEKQDVDVFPVPAHNDVDESDILHDFKTVRLVWTFRTGYRFVCNKTGCPGWSRGTYQAGLILTRKLNDCRDTIVSFVHRFQIPLTVGLTVEITWRWSFKCRRCPRRFPIWFQQASFWKFCFQRELIPRRFSLETRHEQW